MNTCILMAEIVEDPQLRYTTDNLAITEMLVQFPGLRAEDPQATLKVVGWGKLAQEIQQNYHKGDRIVVEGRLGMNTVPVGDYKEKRAELTAQRIHPLGTGVISTATATDQMSSNETVTSPRQPVPEPIEKKPATVGVATEYEPVMPVTQSKPPSPTYAPVDADVDDIPF